MFFLDSIYNQLLYIIAQVGVSNPVESLAPYLDAYIEWQDISCQASCLQKTE